jgi:dienelactone hydrolase
MRKLRNRGLNKSMKITHIIHWLLTAIAIFLTSCTGLVESQSIVTNTEAATATVAASATTTSTAQTQPTATPTVTPVPTGGSLSDDDLTPTAIVPTAPLIPPSATPTSAVLTTTPTATVWATGPHPLQIEVMRQQSYPGSPITVEQTLTPGANYDQYVVSYQSEGYKIYALMTVPNGTRPASGWPAIVFNHGYITPSQYRTTERYEAYVDAIARSGYIVFKSDYRGHGDSEGGGSVVGVGYGSPAYTVDVLNAVASLQAYEDADPNRIGMWGHSMGGQLTLRAMVVSQDIKAGVIWGGSVAPYPDIIERWGRFMGYDPSIARTPPPESAAGSAMRWVQSFSGWIQDFSTQYGTPEQNPDYWATISPNTYLADLSGPIELHHSTTDRMVPLAWSEALVQELEAVGQPYEFYTYPGDNHNISANFGVAMQRTLAFFDKYVKGQ